MGHDNYQGESGPEVEERDRRVMALLDAGYKPIDIAPRFGLQPYSIYTIRKRAKEKRQ